MVILNLTENNCPCTSGRAFCLVNSRSSVQIGSKLKRVRYEVEPFPYVLIDELYNEWELEELWEEMEYLCSPRRLVVADLNNGSATSPNGELLKFNHCQYLEDVYQNRNHSSILQITEKIFMENRKFFMSHPHWYFPGTNIQY